MINRKLNEKITHDKDGVWIQYFSGLNADCYYVEVWKDGKMVEGQDTYANGYGQASYKAALEKADDWSNDYNLPIIDGTGIAYYTFPSEYRKRDSMIQDKDFDLYHIERFDYSDEDAYKFDDREEKAAVWVRFTAPGEFEGLEVKAKNPSRLYDTRPIRMSDDDYRNYYRDMSKYLEDNEDKLKPYTWDEVKELNYAILKNGVVWTDKVLRKKAQKIAKWELEFVPGNKRLKLIANGEFDDEDDYDSWTRDITNLKQIIKLSSYSSESHKMEVGDLIDIMEITGKEVPEEFELEYKDYDFEDDSKTRHKIYKGHEELDQWYDNEDVIRPATGMVIEDQGKIRNNNLSSTYDRVKGNRFYLIVGQPERAGGDFLAIDCTDSKETYHNGWYTEYQLSYDSDKARKVASEASGYLKKYDSMRRGYAHNLGTGIRYVMLRPSTSIGPSANYKLDAEKSNEIGLYKPVNESKTRSRNHRLWENVSEPYIDDVVETLKSDPKVIDAYYNEDDKHFVVRVEGNKDGSEAYSLIRSTMSKVDDILAANKCEIGGIGWIHNDDFDAWTKDFEANKPRPVDPSRDYSWKQRSYYDRTKGKGSKLLAKYHDEYDAWRKEYLDGLKDHPRNLSGFTFDVTWRGHAADVANFYKDTKYWGD